MPKDTLRLCLLTPEGELTFPTIPHTVVALHDQVRGYFETFPLPPQLQRRGLVGLCNEDGQRLELAYNAFSPLLGQTIVGPVLVVRTRAPEFVNLNDANIAVLQAWFGRLVRLPL